MCSNMGSGCASVRLESIVGVAVFGKVVGLSLCWVVCWYGEGLVCVWVSVWVMLPVGEIRFHPRVRMVCVHCFFMWLEGWSATRSDCGIMSGQ